MGKASRRKHEKHDGRGGCKLSDALLRLIEPFNDQDLGLNHKRVLLNIAAATWNITLLPDDEIKPMIGVLIDQFAPPKGDAADHDHALLIEEFKEMIKTLIQRKFEFFPLDRRYIAKLAINERPDKYHIGITSVLLPLAETTD